MSLPVIVGILIALTALVAVPRIRSRWSVSTVQLGWMSERWLAEYRASHPW